MRSRVAQLCWVVVALGLLLGIPPGAVAADQSVTATASSRFQPGTVTVNQGESVTWNNAGGLHNVHFDDNSFVEPPSVSFAAWTVSRTFSAPGSFRYYCEAHGRPGGAGMAGTVNVVAAGAGPGGPGATGTGVPGGQTDTSAQGGPQKTPGAQCASQRRFTIRLRGLEKVRVRSALVAFNGKQLPVQRQVMGGRRRHTALVDLRGLPRGAYTVNIEVMTTSGTVLRGTRTYMTCADRRTPSRLPRL
jgi:plastocyanin